MGRIEKTVFISYRRTNFWTALAVFQNLNANGYDVFFDYKSIPSGDFEQAIIENVISRAHFIVILSPSALERCNEPGDWLRREVETAIDNKRNIIPLTMESFDFGSLATVKALTGKLSSLKKYNALSIPAEFFDEAMARLRSERFLNRPLESVPHSVSSITKQITEEQKSSANKVPAVEKEQLTAQEWLERGFVLAVEKSNYDEAIYCFTQAITLTPDFSDAYYNRGLAYKHNGNLDKAIQDYDETIRLKPDELDAYFNRGLSRAKKGEFDAAIQDYNEVIRLRPNDSGAYNNRGMIRREKGDLAGSIKDFDEAISLKPDYVRAYNNRARVFMQKGEFSKSIIDFLKVIFLQISKTKTK